ncbi:MAG: hypothetical protein WBG65_11080, partial [Sulfurimonadaceae bacterium]
EIGMRDVDKFLDLYPESLRALKELPPEDFDIRTKRYLREKLAIIADGETLGGYVTAMRSGAKIQRDPITGVPLPLQGSNAPKVLYITIMYPFTDPHPKALQIKVADNRATVGFILYHMEQAVNDFRYLAHEQTLALNWEDPFYSSFSSKALSRQYRHPMSLFLYVEPYEVRKEFVLRPKDLQEWIELGLESKELITVADQETIKRKVAAFLMDRAKVTIDGKEMTPRLDRIHFIERTLKRSGVITPPRDLPTSTATLGVIYTYPVTSLPQDVRVYWDLFSKMINYVPATVIDEAGPFYHFLDPDNSELMWENYIRFPKDHSINSVHVVQETIALPWLALIFIILFVVLMTLFVLQKKKGLLLLASVSLLAALISWPLIKVDVASPLQAKLDEKEARLLLHELLSNVYRSFVFKEEGAIYDALSKSADGDLLSEIYLQVKRSLELKNQGGAEASVDTIEIKDLKLTELDKGYALDGSWDVNGSVGHWGHIHQRSNHYDAEFVIEPVNDVWKIKTMKVYNEERIK